MSKQIRVTVTDQDGVILDRSELIEVSNDTNRVCFRTQKATDDTIRPDEQVLEIGYDA